jgi:branched-chain amino acid transport system substrate-binding protein
MLGGAGVAGVLSACGNSLTTADNSGDGRRSIKVGLVIPQAGVYTALGTDMKRGWDLWLERHGGKFGDYTVTTVTADEGETPQTGVPAVQKLLQSDQVDVLVGIVSSATALGVKDMVSAAKKLLIVSNAGAGSITGPGRSPYIWRTSFTNAQVAGAMGRYLSTTDIKTAYAIAPDYAAGAEAIEGFTKEFTRGGGTVVGQDKPPFGKTQDYQPYLSRIQASRAQATFCFFGGAESVAFVKQYAQFGLSAKIPIYASGFLTEGGVLAAQGDAALGVKSALHYTSELDNRANNEFRNAYQARYDAVPNCYAVATWDAAAVLHRALKSPIALDGDSLVTALSSLGPIEDSPRGAWSFDGQSPQQEFYLRTVERHGSSLVNAVTEQLGRFGQST